MAILIYNMNHLKILKIFLLGSPNYVAKEISQYLVRFAFGWGKNYESKI